MAAYLPPGTPRGTGGNPQRDTSGVQASLERILAIVRDAPTDPFGEDGPLHRCARCADTGLACFESGTFTTPGGQHIEASPTRPVYRRCPACSGVRSETRA